MRFRSLRSRLFLGAILGALGLLPLTHLVSMEIIVSHPKTINVSHHVLVIIGVIFIIFALLQVRKGLNPLDLLRERLAMVRDGRAPRIEGTYPTEVQPLVNDLNALLDHREGIVRRAQAKAGDLAHGLKTPLAVLSREAELASAAGHADLADTLGQQVERMRRQVDYHLAHARAAASGAALGARIPVLVSAEALCRTLVRLHADRGLTLDVNVSPDHSVRVVREDLDEMLGNLLDNACKWAKSRVTVSTSLRESTMTIMVDDDGPGLDRAKWDLVFARGVGDSPGSGLGLAIVRDLAELYSGSVSLGESHLGGLQARLHLPAG
jgi:signal transduction histidine kinase